MYFRQTIGSYNCEKDLSFDYTLAHKSVARDRTPGEKAIGKSGCTCMNTCFSGSAMFNKNVQNWFWNFR